MMGVVELLPEWLLLLPFAVLPVCLRADDKRRSHHYPFASTMSGVPFDCCKHWGLRKNLPHISARHERGHVSYFTEIFDRAEGDHGAANASHRPLALSVKPQGQRVGGPGRRIHRKGAAGGPKSQSTFHCRGADRTRQSVGARASVGLLGPAPASVLSVAKRNGPGIEAAIPATMGAPNDVAAIVIVIKDMATTSTSITMRFEKCFVMS